MKIKANHTTGKVEINETLSDINSKIALPYYAEARLAYDKGERLKVSYQKIIPYSDALDAIQWVINKIAIDSGFISYPVYRVLQKLLFVKYYSNYDLSELDGEELTPERLYEIYDIVMISGIEAEIEENIDKEQKNFILSTTEETINSILNYHNSAAGIIEDMIEKAHTTKELSDALDILQDTEKFNLVQKILQTSAPSKEELQQAWEN